MRTSTLLLLLAMLCSCAGDRTADAQPESARTPAGEQPAAAQPAAASPAHAVAPAPASASAPRSALVGSRVARRALRNDGVYQEFLAKVAKAEPPAGDTRYPAWLQRVASAAAEARSYERAADYARRLVAGAPGQAEHHAELSAALGRLGRFDEALTAADQAATLPGGDTIQVRALRAGWRCALGRHEQGRTLFAAVPPPAEGAEDWPIYLESRTFVAACDHDLALLRGGVAALAMLGGRQLELVQRDAIYDPYRGLDWFIAAAGETLAP
jgi:Flp pilus assembly protein TadD